MIFDCLDYCLEVFQNTFQLISKLISCLLFKWMNKNNYLKKRLKLFFIFHLSWKNISIIFWKNSFYSYFFQMIFELNFSTDFNDTNILQTLNSFVFNTSANTWGLFPLLCDLMCNFCRKEWCVERVLQQKSYSFILKFIENPRNCYSKNVFLMKIDN